jgi:ADP-ribose pyrophosphatase YjhB (NUDIX family)
MKYATKLTSHFGVYALVFDASGKKLLMIRKARGCYTGRYDLPGGGMEPHELLEETLVRETFEETGCYITAFEQLGVFSDLFPHKIDGAPVTLRHIGAIYTASISGTPRATGDGTDDSDGCVWVPVAELNEKNTVPLILHALKKHAETAAA